MNQETLFRKEIIKFIVKNKLDIAETARILGVESRTVSKWMSGELEPHEILKNAIMEIMASSGSSANNRVT